MVWLSALILVFVGVALIVVRRSAARVQSLLAGGNVLPGCVIFEGAVFVALAIALLIAHARGML